MDKTQIDNNYLAHSQEVSDPQDGDTRQNDLKKDAQNGNKFIGFLRSEFFVLITFVCMAIPLMFHTAILVQKLSGINNMLYAYFFAFAFDLAIFMFAIHGERNIATFIALIVFLLNTCFFNYDTLSNLFDPVLKVTTDQKVKLFVSILVSGASTGILHGYVAFFNRRLNKKNQSNDLIEKNFNMEMRIRELSQKIITSEENLSKQITLVNQLTLDRKENSQTISKMVPVEKSQTLPGNLSQKDENSNNGLVSHENDSEFLPIECRTCKGKAKSKRAYTTLVNLCQRTSCELKTEHQLVEVNL